MESKEEVLARLRFLQTVSHRSAPPHCHPLSILILTLSGGFVFVGMVMTTVAHWPGSVSVGFDPLRIPGPILLAVSFVVFMVGIFFTCVLNHRERTAKKNQLVDYAMSTSKIDMNASLRSALKRNDVIVASEAGRRVTYDETDVTSSLLEKAPKDADVDYKVSKYGYHDNRESSIPEPRRAQKEKKGKMERGWSEEGEMVTMEEKEAESLEEGDESREEYGRDDARMIVTTTTTTVTKKTKKKKKKKRSKQTEDEVEEGGRRVEKEGDGGADGGSLKIKIKTKAGTSVNITPV